MRAIRGLTLAVVAVAVLVIVPVAHAGGPGNWTQVTGNDLPGLTEVSLVRTPDGVLHAVWTGSVTRRDVFHRGITAGGRSATATDIVLSTPTGGFENPAIVLEGTHLRAFIPGIYYNGVQQVNALFTQTSDLSGSSWTSSPAIVTLDGQVYGSSVRAVVTSGGTSLQTWRATSGVWTHAGLSSAPGPGEYNNAVLGGNGYYSNLREDVGDHTVWLAWWALPSLAHDKGVWVNMVNPANGNPLAAPIHLPGSSVSYGGAQQSVSPDTAMPMVARPLGGGVYVAAPTGYPTARGVRVWKLTNVAGAIQTGFVNVASGTAGKDNVALTATPDGRLWVLWTQRATSGAFSVYARRSNKAAAVWGATVRVAAPKSVYDVYRLAADGQATRVDVLAQFGISSAPATGGWHTQILPGLSLGSSRTSLKAGVRYRLTFKVRDAGDPVKGAVVKLGGATGKTGAAGNVTLTVGPFRAGTQTATAAMGGYVKASVKLRVTR